MESAYNQQFREPHFHTPPTPSMAEARTVALIVPRSGSEYVGTVCAGATRGEFLCGQTGHVYSGQFDNDGLTMHGKGKLTYPDGGVFSGTWVHGAIQGYGEMVMPRGDVYKKGEFEDGVLNGQGTCSLSDGSEYRGAFVRGKMHGPGEMVFASKDVYTGDWVSGLRHGRGQCMYADGRVYRGEWFENTKHGYGEFTTAYGNIYRGEWADDDLWHGYGENVTPNSDIYSGAWSGSRRCGHAVTTYADGSVYRGQYSDGEKHGVGEYVYASGEIYCGEFFKGRHIGTARYISRDGSIYDRMWECGQMTEAPADVSAIMARVADAKEESERASQRASDAAEYARSMSQPSSTLHRELSSLAHVLTFLSIYRQAEIKPGSAALWPKVSRQGGRWR